MLINTLILLLSLNSAMAESPFINSHQHLIFKEIKSTNDVSCVDAGVLINNRVPGHSSNYLQFDMTPTVYETIPLVQHEFEKKYANAVFVATTGTGTARGTAFLVGVDLVLTNKHVLANNSECMKFSIDLNHRLENVTCKKVEYCDEKKDFCLIRMNNMSNGKQIGDEVEPLRLEKKSPKDASMAFIIGDAFDLGIQAASYFGLKTFGEEVAHCIRAFSGNSGSPILNDNGNVIGIHYARGSVSGISCPSDRETGFAVASSKILTSIKNINFELYNSLSKN